MKADHNQQANARRPNQFEVALQKMPVTINRLGPQENLQVADQVSYYEKEKDKPGHRHDILLAQRRLDYMRNYLHETKVRHPKDGQPGCATEGIYCPAASGQEPKLIFSAAHYRSNHILFNSLRL